MIGIILAGHGNWPSAMKNSMELIMGVQRGVSICEVTDIESADEIRLKMDHAMKEIGECYGYIFLLDLFGGSPSHAVVSYGIRNDLLALTGVNLAMLIQLISIRDNIQWNEISSELLETGKAAVRDIFDELKQCAEEV